MPTGVDLPIDNVPKQWQALQSVRPILQAALQTSKLSYVERPSARACFPYPSRSTSAQQSLQCNTDTSQRTLVHTFPNIWRLDKTK